MKQIKWNKNLLIVKSSSAEIGRVERFKAEFAAATIENEKKLNENFLKYRDDKILVEDLKFLFFY
jgi:hypothetical protein